MLVPDRPFGRRRNRDYQARQAGSQGHSHRVRLRPSDRRPKGQDPDPRRCVLHGVGMGRRKSTVNLNTHILIYAFSGDLPSSQQWSISAIVLWELAKLARMRKWTSEAIPPTNSICATSMVHEAAPLTRDQRLRKSSVVPLA